MDKSQIESSGLPARCYTEPTILDLEIKAHFEAGWISIGVAQMVPEPGDAYPLTVAGRELLLARDRAGVVHVFHNVCRHRGTQLVTEKCTRANGLVTCPYHSWTYSLDGTLEAAPYRDGTASGRLDTDAKQALGLLPVRMAVWCDIVFVDLSGSAATFDEFIQPLNERWASFDLDLLRLATIQDFRLDANWKFACENFLDSYHLPFVHPQMGEPGADSYSLQHNVMSRDILGYIMPLFGVGQEELLPGPVFPKIPEGFETALDLVYVFPNTLLVLTASWIQLITVQADGPGHCNQMLFGYLVGDEAVAEAGEALGAELRGVNSQDLDVLARMQKGRSGNASEQGVFAPAWDRLGVMFLKRVAEAY
jgi:choline monooxygenase